MGLVDAGVATGSGAVVGASVLRDSIAGWQPMTEKAMPMKTRFR